MINDIESIGFYPQHSLENSEIFRFIVAFSKQAIKQTSKHAGKHFRHSVGAMPCRGLFLKESLVIYSLIRLEATVV